MRGPTSGCASPGGTMLVIGDFDRMVPPSTALVVRSLRAMHFAACRFLVPNRFASVMGSPLKS